MLTMLYLFIRDALFLLGYLSGGQGFPKPLTKEMERACFARMSDGDEEARQTLIAHNLRLVSHVVRKFSVPGHTQDDLVSVGTMGLMKAVSSYDVSAHTPFSTYAARCIENEVLMLLRASKKYKGDVSITDPIGTDGEGNDVSFADILGSPTDMVEDEVIRRISLARVREMLRKLPIRERTVLELRYGLLDGRARPQHEIASLLQISRSYVSRVEKHGIELLREGFAAGAKEEQKMAIN